MRNSTTIPLVFDYYESFMCIGSKCESTCCNSWLIIVDPKSVAKYKELDKKHNSDFFKHIVPYKNDKLGFDGHIIQFLDNEQKSCPYLTTDNLCGMITRHGLDAQCKVCRVYPRVSVKNLQTEKTIVHCALSCPEVVRKAILREAPLKTYFLLDDHVFVPQPTQTKNVGNITKNHLDALGAIHHNFVSILQNREVSLEKRLTGLLLLSSLANKQDSFESFEQAKGVLQESEKMSKHAIYNLPDLQPNIINQFDLFLKIMQAIVIYKRNTNTPVKKSFFNLIDKAFLGFNIKSFNEAAPENIATYQQAIATYIIPLLNEKEYIFENLAAHHFISSSFPFTKGRKPLANFIHFIVIFTMIRNLMAGYANYNNRLNNQDITDIIFTTYRALEHDTDIVKVVNNVVEQLQAGSTGQLYTLLALQ